METAQHWDRLPENQPAEITMFQISEVQDTPAFNGRRSFLDLRGLTTKTTRIKSTTARISRANKHPRPSAILLLISSLTCCILAWFPSMRAPQYGISSLRNKARTTIIGQLKNHQGETMKMNNNIAYKRRPENVALGGIRRAE